MASVSRFEEPIERDANDLTSIVGQRFPATVLDLEKRNISVATRNMPQSHKLRVREMFVEVGSSKSKADAAVLRARIHNAKAKWNKYAQRHQVVELVSLPESAVNTLEMESTLKVLSMKSTLDFELRGNPARPERVTLGQKIVDVQPISDGARAFSPSRKLISIWIEGMNQNYQEANRSQLDLERSLDDPNLTAEVSRQVRKVINNFARRKAYDGGSYRITFGRKLIPTLQNLFLDHLMLPPLVAKDFLTELTKLVYEQSTENACFKGRWGQLVIDDLGELVITLEKRKRRSLDQMIRG